MGSVWSRSAAAPSDADRKRKRDAEEEVKREDEGAPEEESSPPRRQRVEGSGGGPEAPTDPADPAAGPASLPQPLGGGVVVPDGAAEGEVAGPAAAAPGASAGAKRWPNNDGWSAMRAGAVVMCRSRPGLLSVIDAGPLTLPTGRVIVCDPFVDLLGATVFAEVPPGVYPVHITLADLSPSQDGSEVREAYATLVLDAAVPEVRRGLLGSREGLTLYDDFNGFNVDTGTACFADAGAVASAPAPPDDDWHSHVFDHEGASAWFRRMDDPSHVRPGVANVPLGTGGVVLWHSGFGDGTYPVIAGYGAGGQLVALHVDMLVVGDAEEA